MYFINSFPNIFNIQESNQKKNKKVGVIKCVLQVKK